MSNWAIVFAAAGFGYLTKLAGYLVPARLVSGPRTARIIALLPVALLAALVIVQTIVSGDGSLTIDARMAAVAVAIALLIARANFLVVVIAAAAVAALLRAAGMS